MAFVQFPAGVFAQQVHHRNVDAKKRETNLNIKIEAS
jgi:hypothetical protein